MAIALNTDPAMQKEGLKVDLACGSGLHEGYVGVDSMSLEDLIASTPGMQENREAAEEHYAGYIQHDLFDFPWPFEDSSIAAIYCSHFVEHIPHYLPGVSQHATDDAWWYFFKEVYRVMEDGGIIEIIHPFSRSDRAFWDPTHTRYVHFQTWFYLSKKDRIDLGVNHYAPDIDFEVISIQTVNEPQIMQERGDTFVEFARSFYFNPAEDLFAVLKVIKS